VSNARAPEPQTQYDQPGWRARNDRVARKHDLSDYTMRSAPASGLCVRATARGKLRLNLKRFCREKAYYFSEVTSFPRAYAGRAMQRVSHADTCSYSLTGSTSPAP
jgi:hypothetical protein